MKKIKIFDVVELNSSEKATILKSNETGYWAEIVDTEGNYKRHDTIYEKDINQILYKQK